MHTTSKAFEYAEIYRSLMCIRDGIIKIQAKLFDFKSPLHQRQLVPQNVG